MFELLALSLREYETVSFSDTFLFPVKFVKMGKCKDVTEWQNGTIVFGHTYDVSGLVGVTLMCLLAVVTHTGPRNTVSEL